MDLTLRICVVGVLFVLSQSVAQDQAWGNGFPNRYRGLNKGADKTCEWKLVFKAVQGGGNNVFTDFTSGGDINGGVPGSLDLSSPIPFRDTILDNWNGIDVTRVKVLFLDKNVRVAWFLFDGVASSMQDWFSKDNLIASSYPDLKDTATNFFSIPGDAGGDRRFFINQNFGGCPNDCGFVGVVHGSACGWESIAGEAKPYFVYSDKDTCTTWQDAADGAKVADTMAIFIKVCDEKGW